MSFLRQTMQAAAGAVGSQLVILGATPWLAREYPPAAFGGYALFFTTVMLATTIGSLRYEMMIPAVAPATAVELAWLSTLILVPVSLAISLLVACGQSLPIVSPLAVSPAWLALAVTGAGLLQIAQAMTVRSGALGVTAMWRILQAVLFVALALTSPSLGLGGACAIAFSVGIPACWFQMRRVPWPGIRRLRATARSFRDSPMVLTPTALLDAASLAMPLYTMAQQYGDENTGHYTQIQRLASAPLLLLSGALAQALLSFGSRNPHQPTLVAHRARLVLLALAGGGTCCWLIVLLAGTPLFAAWLGPAWRTDTTFLMLCVSPAIFRVIVSPLTSLFVIMQQVRLGGLWQTTYFLTTCGTLFAAASVCRFETFLLVFGIHEAILYGACLCVLWHVMRRTIASPSATSAVAS